jgi:hypothetical protein
MDQFNCVELVVQCGSSNFIMLIVIHLASLGSFSRCPNSHRKTRVQGIHGVNQVRIWLCCSKRYNILFFFSQLHVFNLNAYVWWVQLLNYRYNLHCCTMRNHLCQNHITLQLKFKKQLAYNYYPTIPWVLQLPCNYPLKNTVY